MRRTVAALAVAVLAGCASVGPGDPQQDASLKTYTAPPDRGGIFVVRDGTAPFERVDIDVDGVPLGQLVGHTYLHREVVPGRHKVAAHAENTATLEFDVDAGTLAFVRQEMTWGFWQPRAKLVLVSEEEGRQAVLGSRLVASLAPVQDVEVVVDAQDPAWRVPLACEASNPFGRWPFSAPGKVTVDVARAPLRIVCQPPSGVAASPAAEVSVSPSTAAEKQRHATGTGAAVGAGLGLAAAIAAAPILGPALAGAMAAQSAVLGAQMGVIADAVTPGGPVGYASPIVLTIPKPAP
jgi:hypothetical protein